MSCYLTHLEESKSSKPANTYWYSTYQFLRRYLLRIPQEEWPECLWIFYNSIEECGLQQLIEADVSYRKKLKEKALELDVITENNNPYHKKTTADRLTLAGQLRTMREQKVIELQQLRQSHVQTISEINCFSEMFMLWKQTYLLLMKHQEERLSENDLTNLQVISNLCAEDYGDVVHWAEGLLSAYLPNGYVENDCGESIDQRSFSSKKSKDFKVFPNPVKEVITVEISDFEDCTIRLKGIDGKVIFSHKMTANLYQMEVASLSAGLYYIEKRTENGIPEVKKIVVKD